MELVRVLRYVSWPAKALECIEQQSREGCHGVLAHHCFTTHPLLKYSGGQATEGQGGYYGSGGARVLPTTTAEHHTELLALAADVEKIDVTMKELEVLESLLSSEETNKVTSKSIELRQNIKKLMTSPEFLDSLNRLEVNGQPIWGLNSDEREMITLAREKVTKV